MKKEYRAGDLVAFTYLDFKEESFLVVLLEEQNSHTWKALFLKDPDGRECRVGPFYVRPHAGKYEILA